MSERLYMRTSINHTPMNVNTLHKAELRVAGVNKKIAVKLTEWVGTMWTAYVFCLIAVIGLFGLLGWLNSMLFLLMAWLSQQFLQLVLLPTIMVGQNVQSEHAELMAEEDYKTVQKLEHDLGQLGVHMDALDKEMLAQGKVLRELHAGFTSFKAQVGRRGD